MRSLLVLCIRVRHSLVSVDFYAERNVKKPLVPVVSVTLKATGVSIYFLPVDSG